MSVNVVQIGFACFGAVVGSMTHYVAVRTKTVGVKWLGSMVVVISGGAVATFNSEYLQFLPFAPYAIGLAIGFFSRPLFVAFGNLMKDELDADKAVRRKRDPGPPRP